MTSSTLLRVQNLPLFRPQAAGSMPDIRCCTPCSSCDLRVSTTRL